MLDLCSYRVKHFKAILKNKTYLSNPDLSEVQNPLVLPRQHNNLRGAEYYQ